MHTSSGAFAPIGHHEHRGMERGGILTALTAVAPAFMFMATSALAAGREVLPYTDEFDVAGIIQSSSRFHHAGDVTAVPPIHQVTWLGSNGLLRAQRLIGVSSIRSAYDEIVTSKWSKKPVRPSSPNAGVHGSQNQTGAVHS
jgi:hypothetical protein